MKENIFVSMLESGIRNGIKEKQQTTISRSSCLTFLSDHLLFFLKEKFLHFIMAFY